MKKTIRTLMIQAIFVLFSLFALVVNVDAQEQKQQPSSDSSANKTQTFDTRRQYPSPAFSFPMSFKTEPDNVFTFLSQSSSPLNAASVPGYLRLSLASPLPHSWESQQKLTLASCWRNELSRQREYDTFRMILGSIEAGGAAYLAYKHIKKYGLK
jgi:hypothetical protein